MQSSISGRTPSRLAVVFPAVFVVVLFVAPAPARGGCFLRGDVDGDRVPNISDAIQVLNFLFGRGTEISCRDAADVNDDGALNVTDAVFLLQHLFRVRGGLGRLPPPTSYCAPDPTEDGLSCEAHALCGDGYGLSLDAEAVFFVVDRSGSMQATGELAAAKASISCVLDSLGEEQQFGIVFVDRGILEYPASGQPAAATPEAKAGALAWLAAVEGSWGSCVQEGLLTVLDMANQASVEPRGIVYIGDGGGSCGGQNEQVYLDETLEAVDEANTQDVVIHTVGVLWVSSRQRRFLEELAARSGGEFVRWVW